VIHTVGPVWCGGNVGEAGTLAACHENAIAVAAGLGCETVAFPAISTGVYGYPVELAAEVAAKTTARTLAAQESVRLVRFVLFDEPTHAVYAAALSRVMP
jgi:O-acetyl-ADP-ribose deacetylase (regulator of RNase III)